ncbi:FGGY-family carbohydrate kinase [Bradyrhizobium sp. SZCCHNS1054]|uniref:xylulokinase n=1 Tax=Bradyrhizobium sp. SZCCHNS1054 TaxID=3057301 RepID=UPI0029160ED5|nr:FGGY-family carbohydrate kinase [Bradyrhizobium sp. SZCCHNS1054]
MKRSLGDASEAHVLAIDLGTSGCKVGIVTVGGRIVSWAFRPIHVAVVDEVGAEQSPDDWWAAFVDASREALFKASVPATSIIAICTSTQGEGIIPVDRDGRPLMNAIIWMDMRGAPYLERQIRGPLNIAGYDALKLLRWVRLTGGAPALSGKDGAGHMLLVRDAFPKIYEKTYKFLNVLDYFNLRLTGRFTATQDSILTSWVTDNRQIDDIRYDDRLIRALGIDRAKFPDLVRCTDDLGPLLSEVAQDLGLTSATRVVAGAIDNSAAAVGAGTLSDGDCHFYVGSSSWIAAHVSYQKTNVFDQITSIPCAVPSKYLMVALQTSGANNIAFLKDRIVFHDDGLIETEPSVDTYDTLDRIVGRMPPGAEGVMYMPWLFGERCPVDDKTLRAGFFNLGMNHNRETLIRAVFEGTALNTRWMMGSVTRFLRHKPAHLTIIGGGGLSSSWCQIFADTLDLPIRRVRDPLKANAVGATIIAAVGLGLTSFSEAAKSIEVGTVFEPNPKLKQLYDDRYELFLDLHQRLAPVYRRLNAPGRVR